MILLTHAAERLKMITAETIADLGHRLDINTTDQIQKVYRSQNGLYHSRQRRPC